MVHIPVLLKEVVEILNPQSGEFFIDGTIGSGGHAVEIFEKTLPNGIFLGVDWDKEAIKRLKIERLKNCKNVILVQGNYANLPEILRKQKLPKANGLILDLGFSSEQLESGAPPHQTRISAEGAIKNKSSLWCGGRGFSFLRNESLDMRYNPEVQSSKFKVKSLMAAEVVNSFNEKDLADIFYKYGEERFSRRIAKKIIEERRKKRILTTFDLVDAIKKATPSGYEKSRIHPATRVFQALRIYVNDELGNLEKLLKNLDKIIKPKGRIAIISFHSLEDRLVKNYFWEMAKKRMAEILTKKPITATLEEIRNNPRARSAKLRAIKYDNHSIK
jgi:16S rRNA (cytosine1402-N4)-methyltransferase